MSEVDRPPELDRRTVELVGFQWDGTLAGAKRALPALNEEMVARGGHIDTFHFHREASTRGGATAPHLEVVFRRRVDGLQWVGKMLRGQWILVWLHHGHIQHVEIAEAEYGEMALRPAAPVIHLPERPTEGLPERAPTSVIRFPHGEDR